MVADPYKVLSIENSPFYSKNLISEKNCENNRKFNYVNRHTISPTKSFFIHRIREKPALMLTN